MSAKIRELPSPRWISFHEIELAFIPFEGKLWLQQSDIRAALAEPKVPLTRWDLEFPFELEHIDPRDQYQFFKLEPACHAIKPETYFSTHAVRYFTRIAGFRKDENDLFRRIDGFVSLLNELDAQPLPAPLMHPDICGDEANHLRIILDKHPHQERVMELWNLGGTEVIIAEVLNIKVPMVRSAVQHLKKAWF